MKDIGFHANCEARQNTFNRMQGQHQSKGFFVTNYNDNRNRSKKNR